jgi:hypothetical protein
MRFDIFDSPWSRSVKMMGISAKRKPFFQDLNFNSI